MKMFITHFVATTLAIFSVANADLFSGDEAEMLRPGDQGGSTDGSPGLPRQVEMLVAHEEIRNTLAGWHQYVGATTWGGDRASKEEDFRSFMEMYLTEDFVFNKTMWSGEPISYDVGRMEWVEVELSNLFPTAYIHAIVGSPYITVDLDTDTADLYYERTLYVETELAPFSFALMRGTGKWRKEDGIWKLASMDYLQYNRE